MVFPSVQTTARPGGIWWPARPVSTLAFKTAAHMRSLGVFVVTPAGVGRAPHSAVDGGPLRDGEYYRHINREQPRGWLVPFGFSLIDSFSTPGDIYALEVKWPVI